jgi:hypothetical protein
MTKKKEPSWPWPGRIGKQIYAQEQGKKRARELKRRYKRKIYSTTVGNAKYGYHMILRVLRNGELSLPRSEAKLFEKFQENIPQGGI